MANRKAQTEEEISPMDSKHHAVHYVIAVVLAVSIGATWWGESGLKNKVAGLGALSNKHWDSVQSSFGFGESMAKSDKLALRTTRGSWPALSQDQVIAMGEALKDYGSSARVLIFCASEKCKSLRADIDDALQIADWSDEFEDNPLVLGLTEEGLIVGGPNEKVVKTLGGALVTAGLPVKLAGEHLYTGAADTAIIIGVRPKQ